MLLALLLVTAAPLLALDDDTPFTTVRLDVPGRPQQAWGATLGEGCAAREARRLVVLSVEGVAPDERRHWTAFDCLPTASAEPSSPSDGAEEASPATLPRLWSRELGPEVVGVDTADFRPDLPGEELLLVTAAGLSWLPGDATGDPRAIPASGPLPLPARGRGIARMPIVDDWESNGMPSALLPTTAGARLVALEGDRRLDLALPIASIYRATANDPPAATTELLRARLAWPSFARGDDDGDGRPDLFALWRFGAQVFRAGEEGLPATPSREVRFRPFDEEQEIRFEASDVEVLAVDLDADGLADLVVDRTMGGMLSSTASTEIHRNPGTGAVLDGAPAARLEAEGAIASVDVVDVDGDGQRELFRTSLRFDVFQMLRFVVTGRAKVEFSLLQLAPDERDGLRETWGEAVSLDVDWDEGRIDGVFPDLRGDVDGDGRRDLIAPGGSGRIEIRLGRAGDAGPAFGGRAGRQPLPITAGSLWPEDLDGDGLAELVVYDPRDRAGSVYVLHNRGLLGAGRPALRARTPTGARGGD